MKCDVYRPVIFDSRGNMRKSIAILSKKTGMKKKALEKRIFLLGLKVVEEHVQKRDYAILLSDLLKTGNHYNEHNDD